MDACTNPDVLRVLLFIKILMEVVFTVIPIAVIVLVMIDFAKNTTNSSDEERKKNLNLAIKRILYGAIIFFVPYIVKLTITVVEEALGEELDYNSCLTNIDNIDYYQTLYNETEEKEKSDAANQNAAEALEKESVVQINNNSSASSEQVRIGKKYNLSDYQLKVLASIAQKEQGTVNGAAAEACLMANRFELFGQNYGTGADGLYNYVLKSGWFGRESAEHIISRVKLKSEIKSVVNNVLVQGDRSYLAPYVDEHDCWFCQKKKCANGNKGDICYIKSNDTILSKESDIKNRNNYIKDKTIIYNIYDSNIPYTFYTFPASNSDPFGYTNTALKKYNSLNNGG